MFWWARFIFFSAVAVFFLEFGIEEMARAYRVNHPSVFLASFFSSSFIILISGALLVAFIWRMFLRIKEKKGADQARIEKP
jgi:TRAP-type C4-dicarboxylate transport system permease small subunit